MEQKAWQTRKQLLAVLIIFWVYLFIGAMIFTTVERRHADDLHHKFSETVTNFMVNNSCIDEHDLESYSDVLIEVYSGGIQWTPEHGFNSSDTHYHHWDLIDSLFFCATVVTTIGYGHLAPSTQLGRSLCILYAMIGIPLSGLLVTIIGQHLKKRLGSLWEPLLAQMHCITSAKSTIGHRVTTTMALIVAGVVFYVILIVIPACLFYYAEGWDWLTSQYYAFISFTTIGFGDYVAGDHHRHTLHIIGRIVYEVLLIFYLLFGMGFVTMLLQALQNRNAPNVKQLARQVRKSGMEYQNGGGPVSVKMLSESDEYVTITTTLVVLEDGGQEKVIDMRDLESDVAFETVSVLDDIVQTQTLLSIDTATQTYWTAPINNSYSYHENPVMIDGSSMTTG